RRSIRKSAPDRDCAERGPIPAWGSWTWKLRPLKCSESPIPWPNPNTVLRGESISILRNSLPIQELLPKCDFCVSLLITHLHESPRRGYPARPPTHHAKEVPWTRMDSPQLVSRRSSALSRRQRSFTPPRNN